MKTLTLSAALATLLLTGSPAAALDSYPAETTDQFMSWCMRSQDQPQSVCSCAINKAVIEIPTSAMASFLASTEGGGMTSTMTGVGATALGIVASCAAAGGDTGTTGGSMLNSLGTSLGN